MLSFYMNKRAFNINYPKLGKISLAEKLLNVYKFVNFGK